MSAANLDINIEQGATFRLRLTLKDADQNEIDLTGKTFRGQVKKFAGSGVVFANFSFTILDQITNIGEVDMTLTATETSAIPINKQTVAERTVSQYAYDVEMVTGSTVERVLQGIASVSPEVTT